MSQESRSGGTQLNRLTLASIKVDGKGRDAYARLKTCPDGTVAAPMFMSAYCSNCNDPYSNDWYTSLNHQIDWAQQMQGGMNQEGLCCQVDTTSIIQLMYSNGKSVRKCMSFSNGPNMLSSMRVLGDVSEPAYTNLTLWKDSWKKYQSKLNEMQGRPSISFFGCTSTQQPTYLMPPFQKDSIALFFKHMSTGPEPMPGFNEKASLKFSPFVDVSTQPDPVTGVCTTYVVLGNKPNMEPAKLVAIDGVSFDCMKKYWTDRAVEFVANDAMISLLGVTQSSPTNEVVNVTVIPYNRTKRHGTDTGRR